MTGRAWESVCDFAPLVSCICCCLTNNLRLCDRYQKPTILPHPQKAGGNPIRILLPYQLCLLDAASIRPLQGQSSLSHSHTLLGRHTLAWCPGRSSHGSQSSLCREAVNDSQLSLLTCMRHPTPGLSLQHTVQPGPAKVTQPRSVPESPSSIPGPPSPQTPVLWSCSLFPPPFSVLGLLVFC